MPQPKSAPSPENSGKWRSSRALPGSIRSQAKTPGWVHKPERLQKQRRAGLQRRVDGGGVAGRGGGANAVMALGGFHAGAAKFGQFLGEAAAALVLGGHDQQGRARRQRAQGERQRAAALDRSGRRQHGEVLQRAGRRRFKGVRARTQGRELARFGGYGREFGRRRAKQICKGHRIPKMSRRCFRKNFARARRKRGERRRSRTGPQWRHCLKRHVAASLYRSPPLARVLRSGKLGLSGRPLVAAPRGEGAGFRPSVHASLVPAHSAARASQQEVAAACSRVKPAIGVDVGNAVALAVAPPRTRLVSDVNAEAVGDAEFRPLPHQQHAKLSPTFLAISSPSATRPKRAMTTGRIQPRQPGRLAAITRPPGSGPRWRTVRPR